jgi:hypothetical protein
VTEQFVRSVDQVNVRDLASRYDGALG